MDLTAKVTALEEEVTVLKGEIKLILQELRTAILARENPFTLASTESFALPASMREERGPSMERAPVASIPFSEADAVPAAPASHEPARPVVVVKHQAPVRVVETEAVHLDVPRLAALVSWTQETALRHTSADLSIVLSLARYSGLIESDLEATLAKIGKTVAPPSDKLRAGIGDLLLALRQLEALIGPQSTDALPHRKVG